MMDILRASTVNLIAKLYEGKATKDDFVRVRATLDAMELQLSTETLTAKQRFLSFGETRQS